MGRCNVYAGMFLTLLLTVSCSEDEKTPAEVPEPVVVTTELTVAGLAGQTATMEATDGTKNEVVFDAEGNAKIETQPAAEGELPIYTVLKVGDKNIRIGRQAGTPIVFEYENGEVGQREDADGTVKVGIVDEFAAIMAGEEPDPDMLAKSYAQEADLYFDGVTDCINLDDISSNGENTGGIAGFNAGNVFSCTNEAAVAGKNFVGGVVGFNEEGYGKIRFGLNNGSVTGTDGFVGGIAGSSYGTISASRNNAKVTGTSVTGGITGGMAAYGYVLACANYGEVEGTENVGGLVGEMRQSGLIEASFSVGEVSGNSNVAAICGVMTEMSGECGVLASYWSGSDLKAVAVTQDVSMEVYYFSDGTTVPQGATAGWPDESQNENWGVSTDGTNSKWWKNLGTNGKTEYPKLWWEE